MKLWFGLVWFEYSLAWNEIGDEGVADLIELLRTNSTITKLMYAQHHYFHFRQLHSPFDLFKQQQILFCYI